MAARGGPPFERALGRCLDEAGLTARSLRDGLLRDVNLDVPENSIESWRRPHSQTGQPSLPRESTVRLLAQWLCSRPGVTVTEEEFLAAWRSDRAARAARRARAGSAEGRESPGGSRRAVRLQRGEWFEGIIDATIYLGLDALLGRLENRLRELLNAGQPIPTYYAYLTHRGYLNWVTLTEDQRYTYYRAGVDLCEATAEQIAAEILRATGHRDVDFVSFGPGTGTKDRAFLHHLLEGVAPAGGSVYYYPYDINPAMIVHAIQTVLARDVTPKLLVKGIIAPFDSLGLFSYVYKDRDGPNVLSLIGNTLGNMSDDSDFLETVFTSGMWSGDLLLLEVRCHVDRDAGAAPGMGDEAKKRFNFGPLEILGADYDDHRHLISIQRERSRSAIPNTVTSVTRCEVVTCGEMTWRGVRLAYVHEYSEPDLDAVIADVGYRTRCKFRRGVRAGDQQRVVLLYLLEKP